MCEAAWSAARTKDTYLSAQFRRFSRRMGKRNEGKAIFAVAHTMIVIVWHILATTLTTTNSAATTSTGETPPPRPDAT